MVGQPDAHAGLRWKCTGIRILHFYCILHRSMSLFVLFCLSTRYVTTYLCLTTKTYYSTIVLLTSLLFEGSLFLFGTACCAGQDFHGYACAFSVFTAAFRIAFAGTDSLHWKKASTPAILPGPARCTCWRSGGYDLRKTFFHIVNADPL